MNGCRSPCYIKLRKITLVDRHQLSNCGACNQASNFLMRVKAPHLFSARSDSSLLHSFLTPTPTNHSSGRAARSESATRAPAHAPLHSAREKTVPGTIRLVLGYGRRSTTRRNRRPRNKHIGLEAFVLRGTGPARTLPQRRRPRE